MVIAVEIDRWQLLRTVTPDDEWMEHAACKEQGYSQYFAVDDVIEDEDRPDVMTRHSMARKICYRDCPVQLNCLRYCIETDSIYLIWGGLTPSQRKRYIGRREELSDDELADIIIQAGSRVLNRIEKEAMEV